MNTFKRILFTLVLVSLGSDFYLRIYSLDHEQLTKPVAETISSLTAINQNKTLKEDVLLQYSKFKSQSAQSEMGQNISTLNTDTEQSGQLKEVFTENKKLTLKAVVSSGTKYVLLNVLDLGSNQQQIEKFNNDSKVYGFNLVIYSHKKVVLTRGQQEIQLVMYQPQKEAVL